MPSTGDCIIRRTLRPPFLAGCSIAAPVGALTPLPNQFRMFVSNVESHKDAPSELATTLTGLAAHLTNEILISHVKIGRVSGGCRVSRKPESQEVESVDVEVAREGIEILAPHEAGRAGPDA